MFAYQFFNNAAKAMAWRRKFRSEMSFCGHDDPDLAERRVDQDYMVELRALPYASQKRYRVYGIAVDRSNNREKFRQFYVGTFSRAQAELLETIEGEHLDVIARGKPVKYSEISRNFLCRRRNRSFTEMRRIEKYLEARRTRRYQINIAAYLTSPEVRRKLNLLPRPRLARLVGMGV